jgi:hypothetical protein
MPCILPSPTIAHLHCEHFLLPRVELLLHFHCLSAPLTREPGRLFITAKDMPPEILFERQIDAKLWVQCDQ